MAFEINTDSAGNKYVNVSNIRITYIPRESRENDKNWSGENVIRIQAYRTGSNSALHSGAEYPVEGFSSIMNLFGAIGDLYAAATFRPCDSGACNASLCLDTSCKEKFQSIYPRAEIIHDLPQTEYGFSKAVIITRGDTKVFTPEKDRSRQERKLDIYKYLIEEEDIDPSAITNRLGETRLGDSLDLKIEK